LIFQSEVFEEAQDISPALLAELSIGSEAMDRSFKLEVLYSSSVTGGKVYLI
jgi:hypothetical protein